MIHNMPQYSAKNLGDPNSARLFCSGDGVGQWVQWDFIQLRVIPTQYFIQIHGSAANCSSLNLWVIEGSIGRSSWTELDRRTNAHDLNGLSLIRSFSISKLIECRFIRLRQTGKNHKNSDVLAFYHFELFGSCRQYREIRPSGITAGRS
jgi:hypothetical protein